MLRPDGRVALIRSIIRQVRTCEKSSSRRRPCIKGIFITKTSSKPLPMTFFDADFSSYARSEFVSRQLSFSRANLCNLSALSEYGHYDRCGGYNPALVVRGHCVTAPH